MGLSRISRKRLALEIMLAGIVGIVSLTSRPIDAGIDEYLRRRHGSDRSSQKVAYLGNAAMVAGIPVLVQASHLFAADARLTNREELGTFLSLSAAQRDGLSDCTLLMHLFRRSGGHGIARAEGAFAFAAWDENTRRLTLGRDCLGERSLFYHVGDGFVAFASELKALLALPVVPHELDADVMANSLALNLENASKTFYRDVERVPSRTLVTIDHSGVRRGQYWAPDFDAPPPYKREQDYIERARELFDQAVLRATEDTPRVAISTSGGLDSSAIAASAARLGRARSITCYTSVPPANWALEIDPTKYLSEREKVDALARMHPGLTVEFCEEGALHPFEENPIGLFARSSAPIRNASNFGTFALIRQRIVHAGHSAMLTGNRGNIGISWSGQYSLLALVQQGRVGTLLHDLRAVARENRRGILKTFAGDVLLRGVPPWLKRILHHVRSRRPEDVSQLSCLNPGVIRELVLSRSWHGREFDTWYGVSGWQPARYRACLLFDDNQIGRDFYAASRTIDGIETRDPHSDRALLEFLLRVPEPLYRQNGVARSFARKVFADRLPSEILDERRRGYQSATWFSRLDIRRQDLATELERLEASPMASRLLDLPRMKRILADWPKDAQEAEARSGEIRQAFARGIHVGQFIRWVEGGNA